MQPDTTAENDLQAAKLKKANEEAKAYRLKLRDAEQTLERTVAEKDAALADYARTNTSNE